MKKTAKPGEVLVGNDRYEGYCVDLMEKLFRKIDDLPYEIQIVKDTKYGNPDENGQWNGMVGELLREVSCRLSMLAIGLILVDLKDQLANS